MKRRKSPVLILSLCLCACLLLGALSGCYFDSTTYTFYPGSSGTSSSSGSGSDEADSSGTATYLTPTRDYTEWQEYSEEELAAEDVSDKEIAYQFSQEDVDLSDRNYDVLVNLYEDGYAQIRQYYLDGSYVMVYFGYWANMDDEYIYFGITCHACSYSSYQGIVYGISYSYSLTITDGTFDTFGLNVAMGFGEGGVYVRSFDMSGDGSVVYASASDFEEQIGYEGDDISVSGSSDEDSGEAEEVATLEGTFTEIVLYSDGTYVFSYPGMSLTESGTWSYSDGVLTLTTDGGSVYSSEDGSLTFTADISSQLTDTLEVSDEAIEAIEAFLSADELVTLEGTFTEIVLYSDGTYVFSYAAMGVSESGTWECADGVLTLTTADGYSYSSSDGSLAYTADISSQLSDTYAVSDDVISLLSGDETETLATLDGTFTEIELYSDGTYVFSYASMGVSESGTWAYEGCALTLTTANGYSYSSSGGSLTYTADISSQLSDTYAVSDETLEELVAALWGSLGESDWLSEDFDGKTVSYQFTGTDATYGYPVVLNLYGDGSACAEQISSAYMQGYGGASLYYGYWTVSEDEDGTVLTVEIVAGYGYTTSYAMEYVTRSESYTVSEEDGSYSVTFTVDLVMGSYSRTAALSCDGSVTYATLEAFEEANPAS